MESMNISSSDSPSGFTPSDMTRDRLFLGEGNFSFSEALVFKHPGVPGLITATEYRCAEELPLETLERVEWLRQQGMAVELGVDGTTIHECFKGRRFRCIHWNFPHDGSSYKTGKLRRIIAEFFQSAREVLVDGGHIHMALAQPPGQEAFRQICAYGIVDASRDANFELWKMRNFGPDRYPGYIHTQTRVDRTAEAANRAVEFIFQKREQVELALTRDYRISPWQQKNWAEYGIDSINAVSMPFFEGPLSSGSSSYCTTSESEREQGTCALSGSVFFYTSEREYLIRAITTLGQFPGHWITGVEGKEGGSSIINWLLGDSLTKLPGKEEIHCNGTNLSIYSFKADEAPPKSKREFQKRLKEITTCFIRSFPKERDTVLGELKEARVGLQEMAASSRIQFVEHPGVGLEVVTG